MFYELYNHRTKFQNTSIQKLLIVYIRKHRTLLWHNKELKASFTATLTHLNCNSILICIYNLKYKVNKYNTGSNPSSHNLRLQFENQNFPGHAVSAEWESNLPLTSNRKILTAVLC